MCQNCRTNRGLAAEIAFLRRYISEQEKSRLSADNSIREAEIERNRLLLNMLEEEAVRTAQDAHG